VKKMKRYNLSFESALWFGGITYFALCVNHGARLEEKLHNGSVVTEGSENEGGPAVLSKKNIDQCRGLKTKREGKHEI